MIPSALHVRRTGFPWISKVYPSPSQVFPSIWNTRLPGKVIRIKGSLVWPEWKVTRIAG